MEQFVLQFADLLHLLVLLQLHLQQLYRQTLWLPAFCVLPSLLWVQHLEDRPRHVLVVEVDFVFLAALLAAAGRQ